MNLRVFAAKVRELYHSATPYDGRRPTQTDLAEAIGLSRAELNKRLNGKAATQLSFRDVRAIVRVLTEWGALHTRTQALELLNLADCPPFTDAEWNAPPLSMLTHEAVAVHQHNLPHSLTSFVGRSQELVELHALLHRSQLLTLTGVGGCGKSRLALELAWQSLDLFADGVWLIELASLRDANLISSTVAQVLQLRVRPGLSIRDNLKQALNAKTLLLLLDNCEHLIEAVSEFCTTILQTCPNVRIVATSRESIRILGEINFAVQPLSLPPAEVPLDELTGYSAIQLFVERIQTIIPSFRLQADNANVINLICQRLDGIPLALELAAVWTRVLSLQEILGRMEDRFELLTVGSRSALRRQQTLKALIDWSYEQLTAEEQLLFRRLVVFGGTFSFDAVEAVAKDQVLNNPLYWLWHLVEKSLVNKEISEPVARYRILETLHQYALKRTALDEILHFQMKHLEYFLTLAEQAAPAFTSGKQHLWIPVLDTEVDNFRAAMATALTVQESPFALRLAVALWRYWHTRGFYAEGLRYLDAVLDEQTNSGEPFLRGRAYNARGVFAFSQGDYALARECYLRALDLSEAANDELNLGSLLNNLGNIAHVFGEYDQARQFYERSTSLRERIHDDWGLANSLLNLGALVYDLGDFVKAAELHAKCVECFELIDDKRGLATSLCALGEDILIQHKAVEARRLFERGLATFHELGDRQGSAQALYNLGKALMALKDYDAAQKTALAALGNLYQLGNKRALADCLDSLAEMAFIRENWERAVKLYAATNALRHDMHIEPIALERDHRDLCLQETRVRLGDITYDNVWNVGLQMHLEQVVADAIDEK